MEQAQAAVAVEAVAVTEDTLLSDLRLIGYDTETTGFNEESGRMVEMAAIRCDFDGGNVETFVALVNPGISIPEAVSKIHGITDSVVAGCPHIDTEFPKFLDFILDVSKPTLLMAHNAEFDNRFIAAQIRRQGLKPVRRSPILCTCELSRSLNTGVTRVKDHKLGTLAGHFGIPVDGAHRTMVDVRTMIGVFLRMARHHGLVRVGDLARLQGDKGAVIHFP